MNLSLPKVSSYSLEFDVNPEQGNMQVQGKMKVLNQTDYQVDELPFLLYHELKIETIADDSGRKLCFEQEITPFDNEKNFQVNFIRIKLDKPLLPGHTNVCYVKYSGSLNGYADVMAYVKDSIDPDFSIIRNDCFAYPVLTYPSNKYWMQAVNYEFDYHLEVLVPANYIVGCGGKLEKVASEKNKKRFSYFSSVPTRRFDITIAEYKIIEDRELALKIFSFPQDQVFAETKLKREITKVYDYFLQIFGNYSGYNYYTVVEVKEKYGSQSGDNYIMMEEHAFKENGELTHLYHEIGHAWNVKAKPPINRCRFFDEAFASYYEALAIKDFFGEVAYVNKMEFYRQAFIKDVERDRRCYEIPIREYHKFEIGYNSYTKGPWVLYVLHTLLGDARFFKVIRKLLNKYKFLEVDFTDFQNVAEEISGQKLNNFFQEWIFGIESSKYLVERRDISRIVRNYLT